MNIPMTDEDWDAFLADVIGLLDNPRGDSEPVAGVIDLVTSKLAAKGIVFDRDQRATGNQENLAALREAILRMRAKMILAT